MWWFLYNKLMGCFLISVSYFRRLVVWELQGAHYFAFSKIIFKFSMNESSKERLGHCQTCSPYSKTSLQMLIPFLQMWCQAFSKWKDKISLHYKPTFNMGLSSTGASITHTWNELHWSCWLRIFSKLTALEGSQPAPERMRAPDIYLIFQRPLYAY